MDQDLEDIIIAGGNDEDIEAAILINILEGQEVNDNNDPQQFNLDELSAGDCKYLFRFEKDDLYRLAQALHMPDVIRTYKGNKVSGVTGVCMVLRRLAYPNRLRDLHMFGYSPQSMALIINRVLDIINHYHGHLLSDLQQLQWLNQQKMELYAQAVQDKGGAIAGALLMAPLELSASLQLTKKIITRNTNDFIVSNTNQYYVPMELLPA